MDASGVHGSSAGAAPGTLQARVKPEHRLAQAGYAATSTAPVSTQQQQQPVVKQQVVPARTAPAGQQARVKPEAPLGHSVPADGPAPGSAPGSSAAGSSGPPNPEAGQRSLTPAEEFDADELAPPEVADELEVSCMSCCALSKYTGRQLSACATACLAAHRHEWNPR